MESIIPLKSLLRVRVIRCVVAARRACFLGTVLFGGLRIETHTTRARWRRIMVRCRCWASPFVGKDRIVHPRIFVDAILDLNKPSQDSGWYLWSKIRVTYLNIQSFPKFELSGRVHCCCRGFHFLSDPEVNFNSPFGRWCVERAREFAE